MRIALRGRWSGGDRSTGTEEVRLGRLNGLLDAAWEGNAFYRGRWERDGLRRGRLDRIDDLSKYPLITREELAADQRADPPLGTNLTCARDEYKRIVRSSGTTREPMYWADTVESWKWVGGCSEALFRFAGVTSKDTVYLALDLGARSGPWILVEGARQLGCGWLTAHEMTIEGQLREIAAFRPGVVVARPSRLAGLADWARGAGLAMSGLGVRRLILTGEPASMALRQRLELVWGAVCLDRYGLTEAGSVAAACEVRPGELHLLDEEYVAEAIDPATSVPVGDGETGELVLTNLGRTARPVIRYRTGDRVRLVRGQRCGCGRMGTVLVGGVTRGQVR